MLYSGVAAGPDYGDNGGGSNLLCLTDEPIFLGYTAGRDENRGHVLGSEFQTPNAPSDSIFGGLFDHNSPCAACYTSERSNQIMIPGTINCTASWTREYYGYLMTGDDSHNRISHVCVDVDTVSVPDSAANDFGVLLTFAEVFCTDGISCPPYEDGYELTCVVCTK